jgi:ribosome-binding protein aMBF1 (putative translation factor)
MLIAQMDAAIMPLSTMTGEMSDLDVADRCAPPTRAPTSREACASRSTAARPQQARDRAGQRRRAG